jgi:uncharacterized protein
MPFFFWDWTMILLVPALLLGVYAQIRVSSTFNRFAQVPAASGLTGAEGARRILDANGLQGVSIEMVSGRLSDHYDPRGKVLRLSQDVGGRNSLASLGVAAHEVGHALQDAAGYAPMKIRSTLVPAANIGSNLGFILFFIGLVMGRNPVMMNIGIVFFSVAVLFTVVTLPVELNASRRAMTALANTGILVGAEADGAKKVLNAAALTYVAAALMAILNLVRLILISRNR